MKWWAQSFLVGVPKIVCGFRDDDGMVKSLQTFKTADIPRETQVDAIRAQVLVVQFSCLVQICMVYNIFVVADRSDTVAALSLPQLSGRTPRLDQEDSCQGQPQVNRVVCRGVICIQLSRCHFLCAPWLLTIVILHPAPNLLFLSIIIKLLLKSKHVPGGLTFRLIDFLLSLEQEACRRRKSPFRMRNGEWESTLLLEITSWGI